MTGFSRSSRQEDLKFFFSRGRDLVQEVIMKSRFAFIEFKRPDDAQAAVAELDNTEFEGRKLTVQRSCKFELARSPAFVSRPGWLEAPQTHHGTPVH